VARNKVRKSTLEIRFLKNTLQGTGTGLPDGLFSNPKSQFGKILVGLRLKIFDVFYGYLDNLTDIWDIV
jgi:hypothetical protein